MDSVFSPTMIFAVLGGLAFAGVAIFLVFFRKKGSEEDLIGSAELLRLEAPPSPRRSPGNAASKPAEDPLESTGPLPIRQEIREGTAPGVFLEGETAESRLQEKARRRARTVVREIMMYNEEKLEKGRREGNVAKYLGREIEMSRKLYLASIDLPESESATYFQESLVAILAGGDRNLLKE